MCQGRAECYAGRTQGWFEGSCLIYSGHANFEQSSTRFRGFAWACVISCLALLFVLMLAENGLDGF